MSWTDGKFTFFSPSKIQSVGMLTFQDYDSATGTYTINSNYTFAALLNHDRDKQFLFSIGADSASGPSAVLHVSLQSEIINCIALQNIDWPGDLSIHINSAPTTPIGADTSTTVWGGLSEGLNLIFRFASMTADTVDFYFTTTEGGNLDGEIGSVFVLDELYSLPRNPNFSDYKPKLKGLREPLIMADGGAVTCREKEMFEAKIKLDYVPGDVTTELRALYKTNDSFMFCPYPTTGADAGWDGDIWEVNWIDDYKFLQSAYNDRTIPLYRGEINLKEVPA